jgi:hypothetical protein
MLTDLAVVEVVVVVVVDDSATVSMNEETVKFRNILS